MSAPAAPSLSFLSTPGCETGASFRPTAGGCDREPRAEEGKPPRVVCDHCGLGFPDAATRLEACRICGPQLVVWHGDGERLEVPDTRAAICEAATTLARGEVVALQWSGGLQLAIDARSEAAVRRLRTRAHRDSVEFTVVTADVEQAREWCVVSLEDEARLRESDGEAVALPRRADAPVAPGVAGGEDALDVVLGYSPLHRLLLRATRFPIACADARYGDDLREIAELLVVDESRAFAAARR